jgi:hypothetical protein
MTIRLHGDSHGHILTFPERPFNPNCYGRNLVKNLADENNIHLGDVDFNYERLNCIPTDRLSIILGNHDNYDDIPAHSLGDYGVRIVGDMTFFFVRGEFSIDYMNRQSSGPNKSWWPEAEELNEQQMAHCLYLYGQIKPNIVLSHGAPTFLRPRLVASKGQTSIYEASRTMKLLEMMWSLYAPKYWYFGHWHTNLIMDIGRTKFVCVDELCYVDVNSDGSIVNGPI